MNRTSHAFRFCLVVFAVLIAAMALTCCGKKETQQGAKTITVDIVTPAGETTTTKTVTIHTDAEFLRGALDQEKLIAGDESEYGIYIKTVDGITANEANQEWWCITKGGETLFTGADSTPIADGDHFELTLTVGYDF